MDFCVSGDTGRTGWWPGGEAEEEDGARVKPWLPVDRTEPLRVCFKIQFLKASLRITMKNHKDAAGISGMQYVSFFAVELSKRN